METWQFERREKLYREASSSPLLDAAFQLWRDRGWLNSMEQVEDGPAFPPLPMEASALEIMPEAIRRVGLTQAHEKQNLRDTQTMKRIQRCQPGFSPAEYMAALKAAIRMTESLSRHHSALMREKAGDEFTCLNMALEITKSDNPGFLDSSYRQAHFDIQRGMF